MALNINQIVGITVNISPAGLGETNFGSICLFDGSNEVPGFSTYYSLADVGEDHAVEGEVYKAAAAWFGEPGTGELNIFGFEAEDDGITDDSAALIAAIQEAADSNWFYWTFWVNATIEAPVLEDIVNVTDALGRFTIVYTKDQLAVSPTEVIDAGSVLKGAAARRSAAIYSPNEQFQHIRAAAKFAPVDFTGVNTVPTLEFKVINAGGDSFTGTEYKTLKDKGYFYNTVIASKGSSVPAALINTRTYSQYGEYIDDVVGTDALVSSLETAVFNALRSQPTKLPYTPAGQQALISAAALCLEQYVRNGFLGERLITDPRTGEQRISRGYEIWTLPTDILRQSDADRAERIAAPLNISVYKAGAIHEVNITLNVQ